MFLTLFILLPSDPPALSKSSSWSRGGGRDQGRKGEEGRGGERKRRRRTDKGGEGPGKWRREREYKKKVQCALRMFSFLSTSETGTKVINLSSVLTHI